MLVLTSPPRQERMLSLFLLILWACPVVLSLIITDDTTAERSTIVDLGYVKYLGNHTRTWPNTVSYLGIPYAEPPVGGRRYRAPLPLDTGRITRETNGKIIDAKSYPEFCIQGAISTGQQISDILLSPTLIQPLCQMIMEELEAKTVLKSTFIRLLVLGQMQNVSNRVI